MKTLPILDERATGIDVGSQKLHVSIAGDTPRVFGTMTQDVSMLINWLRDEGVRSVAMEATGVYWLYLYGALEAAGITVLVVNGRQVRNLPGRKTDMADCQWLATLHAHGLLHSGFVPPAAIRRLQDYLRLRQDHITMAASHVQHMQKALERMNIKFHAVISDLTGVSGLKVIEAILAGQRDPACLLTLCDVQIRKHKADRVKESLRGMWKDEHLFALRQAFEGWQFYQHQIAECDRAIEQVLHELSGPHRDDDPAASPAKPGGTHTPKIDGLHRMLLQLCGGNDPTQLPGLADYSLLLVIGEVGTDLSRWPSEKHFTAWTGLAPGAHQSGKRHGHQSRHRNRTGELFCHMARSLANSVDKALGGFYRRLKARRGGLIANKALARKLAALFWQTMVKGADYVEKGLRHYQARAAQSEQCVLRKLALKHGLALVPVKTMG
ncbi:IS110 family transposase [Cupriavidus sp. TMH.W2]|uniref:IS110 family transposase n=1 Tax=Cupriavidus sp. TMH.W2 TaxID=3434465 RepID=UPI003D782FD7